MSNISPNNPRRKHQGKGAGAERASKRGPYKRDQVARSPDAAAGRAVYLDAGERAGSIFQRAVLEWVANDRRGQPIGVYDDAGKALEAVMRRAQSEERGR